MSLVGKCLKYPFALASAGLIVAGGFELAAPESFDEFMDKDTSSGRSAAVVKGLSLFTQFEPVTALAVGGAGYLFYSKVLDNGGHKGPMPR